MADGTKISLDLSACTHPIFSPRSLPLREINFFYGKNGTGKSSISRIVQEQYSSTYDVRCFAGFTEENTDINKPLNAIVLGTTNVKAQKQINKIDDELHKLRESISEPADNSDNLYTEQESARLKCEDTRKKLNKFYKTSASVIKNKTNPQIASVTYNTRDFQAEINNAHRLDDTSKKNAQDECRALPMPSPITIEYPAIDMQTLPQQINQLLTEKITAAAQPRGIGQDSQKQMFAKEGMTIHNREKDRYCAFCGNELTEERWRELDSLFNNTARKFQTHLNDLIDTLRKIQNRLDSLPNLNPQHYYPPFREEIKALSESISENKASVQQYLALALDQLVQRQNNLFTILPRLAMDVPMWDASGINEKYNVIRIRNEQYGSELKDKKEAARKRLRFHHIAKLLEENNYVAMKNANDINEEMLQKITARVNSVRTQIAELTQRREEQIRHTSNEEIAANRINDSLRSLGNSSFTLRLLHNDNEARGQYQIISDDKPRPIDTLSTGERNLVSFLYFMQQLSERNNVNKPMIVIMDDPMNSNDDASQYLMYSYIQQYYGATKKGPKQKNDDDIFILLTHNAHFFLNVRPYMWKPDYKAIACFLLRKAANHTEIQQVANKDTDDIKTGYAALWHELRYAHQHNQAGFMWNPLRRIITTFSNFAGVPSLEELISKDADTTDCAIAGEIKKGMDVNSHELYDIDVDPNCYQCEDILRFARWYFAQVGYSAHFDHFWKQ
ncbi:AAA family ATPase [Bifidobacterium sp. 82T24]|uniref:AAA family ATPase n=1 Tax=Bifidobacterium pluvialisilvae TaxID=2834436 RepID=UPI001C577D4E|nr:AAA family ATPase [Bifidobacterium pluvialisilvae]MBW3087452.1 AAA family ATPase [Bifidobacterium pluvialisilvae]